MTTVNRENFETTCDFASTWSTSFPFCISQAEGNNIKTRKARKVALTSFEVWRGCPSDLESEFLPSGTSGHGCSEAIPWFTTNWKKSFSKYLCFFTSRCYFKTQLWNWTLTSSSVERGCCSSDNESQFLPCSKDILGFTITWNQFFQNLSCFFHFLIWRHQHRKYICLCCTKFWVMTCIFFERKSSHPKHMSNLEMNVTSFSKSVLLQNWKPHSR